MGITNQVGPVKKAEALSLQAISFPSTSTIWGKFYKKYFIFSEVLDESSRFLTEHLTFSNTFVDASDW